MPSHARPGGPLTRRIVLIVALIMAPIALALVSQQLAATADPPTIDPDPVQVELSTAGVEGDRPGAPSTAEPETVPIDPTDDEPDGGDDVD